MVYALRATVGESPVRDADDVGVDPSTLPLSDRLLLALNDWAEFYTEANGQLGADPEVIEEFVGQGFKLAHRLRSELKGRTIYLVHPATHELIKVDARR